MSAPVSLKQLTDELDQLEQKAAKDIGGAFDEKELEQLRIKLLGKKGSLSKILGSMRTLTSVERPLVGQRANVLKNELQNLLSNRLKSLKDQALEELISKETIDVTIPPLGIPFGHRHPLITTTEQIIDLFCGLGYDCLLYTSDAADE